MEYLFRLQFVVYRRHGTRPVLATNDETVCSDHRLLYTRCENGLWFDHVLEWWAAAKADPEHVLFLHYEDMVADPQKNIQRIADFSGIKCTPEILAKASPAPAVRLESTGVGSVSDHGGIGSKTSFQLALLR